jgi:hypothetical protein
VGGDVLAHPFFVAVNAGLKLLLPHVAKGVAEYTYSYVIDWYDLSSPDINH